MGDIYHEFLLLKNVIHLPTSFINDDAFRICVKAQNSKVSCICCAMESLVIVRYKFLLSWILMIWELCSVAFKNRPTHNKKA